MQEEYQKYQPHEQEAAGLLEEVSQFRHNYTDRLKVISTHKRPIERKYTTHDMYCTISGLQHVFNVLQEMQNMEAHLEAEYGRDSDG